MSEKKTLSKNDLDNAPLSTVPTCQEGVAHEVRIGYDQQLRPNRSILAVIGMNLAIAAVPYGIGGPLMSAIYGGGQLSLFVGLLVVLTLDGCVALSLAELASRYPTSSGLYYWTHQMVDSTSSKRFLSFTTGWCWLIGNWTITLSVNFGFAYLIAATVAIFKPGWTAASWQLLVIFFAVCVLTFFICSSGDRFLPYVDMFAGVWNFLTIVVILISLLATAKDGRHTAAEGFGHYDPDLSGWGRGFTFFIGLLPSAYAFSAIGMITSMAEECHVPEIELPRALSLTIPIGGLAALAFVLPVIFTLPPLEQILTAPYGQALPFILASVTGSRVGSLILMIMVLIVVLLCSISITTAASRSTWAFSRDKAIPLSNLWRQTPYNQPLYALALVTVIQMLLGIISVGSTSAFTAFVSVGVIALSLAYAIPISVSLYKGRKYVAQARWNIGHLFGSLANFVAVCWILFKLILFSMPQTLPVTEVSMNYASVVLFGLLSIALLWYAVRGRKEYRGPPEAVITVVD
ncbi:hypothetical protein E8E13_008450 [Curvularia kusanoi]|uniref:Uncharacterized protein n=1 Tax=Curvularia kusanoi TaxID=90978 RepID=A0A9P4TC23_CURKU|nr:hypothetical protein E8E13_008450 [Curvularia kusanoi]